MIILDASPLIHLTKIGKIEFLLDLFGYALITEAVYQEVVEEGIEKGYSDAILILNYIKKKRIKRVELQNPDISLNNYLHPGESESIQLAKQLDLILVIDENKGRTLAEQREIIFYSTADILLLLLKEKVINFDLYTRNFARYASNGWLGRDVYKKYLMEGKNYE